MFSGAPPVHLMWSNMFDPEKPKTKRPVDLRRIGKLFLPYWKQEALILVAISFIALLGLAPPIFTMMLIDRAIPAHDLLQVCLIAGGMVGSAVLAALIGVYQGYLNAQVAEGIMRDLKVQMMSHLHLMPLDFFMNTRTGEVMNRVSSDVDSIDNVVSMTLVSIVSNFVTIVTTIATIICLDWRLALLSIALIPVMVFPLWPVGRRMYDIRKKTRQKRDELQAVTYETLSLSGVLLLKSFVREQYEKSRLQSLGNELMDIEIKLAMAGRWFMALIMAMVTIGPACVWLVGGWLAINDQITIGLIVTFVALLARLYTPATALAGVQVQVVSALAVFERIFEYLDMPEETYNPAGAMKLGQPEGKVSFDGVTFIYAGGRTALEDVSFTVKPGQVAALVGPSGAGKTTVTMLVPRFFETQTGIVAVDDVDVKSLDLESLREHIGIVTQETYLFHDTVLSNLKYAKADATMEEIVAAAKAANIHAFIESLEKGYETVVGERGHKLSGGERQRLAIARVLLKNPKILILDEATSSLDSTNEALIQAALKQLLKGRTSLVIAHRLSTILEADIIFVLDHGKVVESGKHEELLAENGLYARLYRQQFRDDRDDAE